MSFIEKKWFSILILVGAICALMLPRASAENFVYTGPDAFRVEIEEDGALQISRDDTVLATGKWLSLEPQLDTDVEMTSVSSSHVRISEQKASLKIRHDFYFEENDIRILSRVRNNNEKDDIPQITLGGLRVSGDADPNVGERFVKDRRHRPWRLGAFIIRRDNQFASVCPAGPAAPESLIGWKKIKQDERCLAARFRGPFWAEGMRTVGVTLRFKASRNYEQLLAPYKAWLEKQKAREIRYKTDERPIVFLNIPRGADAVNDNNPFGYADPELRPDKTDLMRDWVAEWSSLFEYTGAGTLVIDGIAGYDERGVDYATGIKVVPPKVMENAKMMAERLEENGEVRLGLTAKPNGLDVRKNWERHVILPLNPEMTGHLKRMWSQFEGACNEMNMRAFWLQDFGKKSDAFKFARFFREQADEGISYWTPRFRDTMLPFTGGVLASEWDAASESVVLAEKEPAPELLRTVFPDCNLAVQQPEDLPDEYVDEYVAFAQEHNLVPVLRPEQLKQSQEKLHKAYGTE